MTPATKVVLDELVDARIAQQEAERRAREMSAEVERMRSDLLDALDIVCGLKSRCEFVYVYENGQQEGRCVRSVHPFHTHRLRNGDVPPFVLSTGKWEAPHEARSHD